MKEGIIEIALHCETKSVNEFYPCSEYVQSVGTSEYDGECSYLPWSSSTSSCLHDHFYLLEDAMESKWRYEEPFQVRVLILVVITSERSRVVIGSDLPREGLDERKDKDWDSLENDQMMMVKTIIEMKRSLFCLVGIIDRWMNRRREGDEEREIMGTSPWLAPKKKLAILKRTHPHMTNSTHFQYWETISDSIDSHYDWTAGKIRDEERMGGWRMKSI